MQNIPRNELLDKLAAGWKVRRKDWTIDTQPITRASECNIKIWQYLECDWEGEPPALQRLYQGCNFTFALQKLFNGAVKIRRTAWSDLCKGYTQGTFSIAIRVEELLAEDWEVWGYE